jgi:hypothetical protein
MQGLNHSYHNNASAPKMWVKHKINECSDLTLISTLTVFASSSLWGLQVCKMYVFGLLGISSSRRGTSAADKAIRGLLLSTAAQEAESGQ